MSDEDINKLKDIIVLAVQSGKRETSDLVASFHAKLEDHIAKDELCFDEIRHTMNCLSKKLDPITDVYKAVLLSKTFVAGLGLVVMSIGAIGAGVVWLVNSVIHR